MITQNSMFADNHGYQRIREYDSMEIEQPVQKNMFNLEWLAPSRVLKFSVIGAICFLPFFLYLTSSSNSNSSSSVSIDQTYDFDELDEVAKNSLFNQFISRYQKNYATEYEYNYRFETFKQNIIKVAEDEVVSKKNGGNSVHGVTKFSDLTHKEVIKKTLGVIFPKDFEKSNLVEMEPFDATVTVAVNWAGIYTTPVKNQGYCGSCWAFAATEQMESDALRLRLPSFTTSTVLSPQQYVDCDAGDNGCNGGWYYYAYRYAYMYGMESTSDYPYSNATFNNGQVGTCQFSANDVILKLSTYYGYGSEAQLATYVASKGPAYVNIDASVLFTYSSGVVSCSSTYSINHAVQVVGINTDTVNNGMGLSYWVVRNSWGTDWGLSGYFYLLYGYDSCGVADYATSTVVYTAPTFAPSTPIPSVPSVVPSAVPSDLTSKPTPIPSVKPMSQTTSVPSYKPTLDPTPVPSRKPTFPRMSPPTRKPSRAPSRLPTRAPGK